MKQEFYCYYSTRRPIDIGTFPRPPDNAPTEICNFDERMPVEDGRCMAWGILTYAKPLTEKEISDYELRPSRCNPDMRRTMAEQASFVGPWEERNSVPAAKRLTQWDVNIEGFSPADGVTPEQLAEHYRLAKKFPRIPRQGKSKDPPQREGRQEGTMPEITLPNSNPFFSVNDWGDALTTGLTLKIVHTLWFSEYNAGPFMSLLTDKTSKELQEMLKDSEAAEKSIFDSLKTATEEWEVQAAQTLLLKKVLEYVRTPEVSHTSNEWKQLETGAWEISNRVYQMRYQFTPVPQSEAVCVSWGIVYNTPQQPGGPRYANTWGDNRFIVRQDKKLYDNAEAAQRYIQGRFNLYAHLFTELSPPIPNDCKRMFTVNGLLLPGYTLAPPERTREDTINDLLDCLEDGDVTPPTPAPEEPPAPEQKTAPSPAKPARSAAKKKSGPEKSGPVR